MPVEMGYLCITCGEHWTTDQWVALETHLTNNPTHKIVEACYSDSDPTPLTKIAVVPVTAVVGDSAFSVMVRNNRAPVADLEVGFLQGLYASVGDLPVPPASEPAWAFVDVGTSFPDVYWWQVGATPGGVEWQQSTYSNTYQRPPDPNGDWILDLSNNPGGVGNNWSSFSMGTEVRILAAGNGKDINGVAFLHGTGGTGTHNWVLLKSTVTGTSAPATNTYTITAASGTFTVTSPGTWTEVSLIGSEVAVATNEWYAVMMWAGSGGLSLSIAAAVKNETYAEINAGIYASGASSTPPGSNPTPTNRQTSTLYGIASLRIK